MICLLGYEQEEEKLLPGHFQVHHIHERADSKKNGEWVDNSAYNLVTLCSVCHMNIHKGEIIIDRYYQTTKGHTLRWKKKDGEWEFSPTIQLRATRIHRKRKV